MFTSHRSFCTDCSPLFIHLPLLAVTTVLLCLSLEGVWEERRRWVQGKLVTGSVEFTDGR